MIATAEPRWWGNHPAETRWLLELGRLVADPVFRCRGVPRGDGRVVLVLPGFLAGDQTLAMLAGWLWRLGYRPRVCGFVANVDCSDRAAERVEQRVHALARHSGRRVALIGHSRGGHFARAVAARLPEEVSHAISMGADLQGMFGISAPVEYAVGAARRVLEATGRGRSPACMTRDCDCSFVADYSAAFPAGRVRLTSLYSRGDGVVRWERCVVPYAECVEVTGSHTGLIVNPQCYRAIAAALEEPELS